MDGFVKSGRPLALVTGGSAGIGLELAHLFAADGYDLVVTGTSERVFEAVESLRGANADVVPVRSDLSTLDGTQAVIDAVAADGRPLDALVLSAGIAIGGAFLDVPLERHLKLLDLNVLSTVRLCHALLPAMVGAAYSW